MRNSRRMTWWSRHDPVVIPHGNTDNWAKLRVRVDDPTRQTQGAGDMQAGVVERRKQMSSGDSRPAVSHPQGPHGDGRVSPRGHAVFSAVVSRDLHGAVPGNYTLVRPESMTSRGSLRTSFNERAKSGFKYWYQERPHPTKFGKYGMGSYKTVLGLGNAPRT